MHSPRRIILTVEATEVPGEYRVSTMAYFKGGSRALPGDATIVKAPSLGEAAMVAVDPRSWEYDSNILTGARCQVRSYRPRRGY